LAVSREVPQGTGVESSSLMLSPHDGALNATTFSKLALRCVLGGPRWVAR